MSYCHGRNRAAILYVALSASGGALLAFYICKRVRELRSQKFPNGIASAIKNEQLAVLAKSANVGLRQSAEQMLLDRILEKDAFQDVISGCSSKDENELYRACSVLCVVLKSVNFSIPLPLSLVAQLLSSCLQRSMDREEHFEVRSDDSVFAIKIQRMTLATICDFLSDSVSNKDVLIQTCPDIIATCTRLADETVNKEVLRYSVLLLFQIAGLGTAREVCEAGAVPVLAKRILTFHRETIMQRITLQTIVILIGSVDDSKPLWAEIATPQILMPTVSSCSSDDVELSFWSLALIQDFVSDDLCTDELISMSYLVKNFLSILKTREGTFKSFVLKILSTLCQRREKFLQELSSNKAFLSTVIASLKDQNGLVVNFAIRFLKVLLQGGTTIIERLLEIDDGAILEGLVHVAKESQKENKLLMVELLTEFIMAEKYVLRIVKGGAVEIVKELSRHEDDANLTSFSSAMMIDIAMISDAVKVEMANACILPTIIRLIKTAKSEKVAVFATKTLVMLHLIDDTMKFSIRSDGKTLHITAGDLEYTDTQHRTVKVFRLECLLSRDVCCLAVQRKAGPSASPQEQVEFCVPGLEGLGAENAGDIIFMSLSGRKGTKYTKDLLQYIQLSDEERTKWSCLSEDDVGVIIAIVGEGSRIHPLQTTIHRAEAIAEVTVSYMTLFQHRTTQHILPSILEPLSDTEPLRRRDLQVLDALFCLESYVEGALQSPLAIPNLLITIMTFSNSLSENELKVTEAVLGILTMISVVESGRTFLVALDAPHHLVMLLNTLLEPLLQSTDPTPAPRNDVFDIDHVPVPPGVAAIIDSLPPRPQSRAEPRSSRNSDASEPASEGSRRHLSSSVSSTLPAIPEDGFPLPEAAGRSALESARATSISSLVDEVIASIAEEGGTKDSPPEEEESGAEVVLGNALLCLTKLISGAQDRENETYRRMQTSLNQSGGLLTLWSHLLVAKRKHKKLQLPIVTTMTILAETIHLNQCQSEPRVCLDASNATRMMVMGTDCLQVANFHWTFESVRATVSIPGKSPSSPGQPEGWFYQMELLSEGLIQVGWANDKCRYQSRKGIGVGDDYDSYSVDGVRKKKWHGPVAEQTEENNYGEIWNNGDVVTCLLDRQGNLSFRVNEKDLGVAFTGVDMTVSWFPACSVCTDQWARFNFGDSPIRFPEVIPDGFVPVSSCLGEPSHNGSSPEQRDPDSAPGAERGLDNEKQSAVSDAQRPGPGAGMDPVTSLVHQEQSAVRGNSDAQRPGPGAGMDPVTSLSHQVQSAVRGNSDAQRPGPGAVTDPVTSLVHQEQSAVRGNSDVQMPGPGAGMDPVTSLVHQEQSAVKGNSDTQRPGPGAGTAPVSATLPSPSLYFEVSVDRHSARPLCIGYSSLDSINRVVAVINEQDITLPDYSTKQLPVQPLVVIGCGYIAATEKFFFTVNGQAIELLFSLSTCPHESVSKPVMPCLSDSHVLVNWGQQEFKYNMGDSEEYDKCAVATCQRLLNLCHSTEDEDISG